MKNITIHKAFLTITVVALSSVSSSAVLAQEAIPDNALRIATGPAMGVYTQMARNIQKVCGQTIPMVSVPSKGGLDNLVLLSASMADLGFAQVDLVQKMGRDGDRNIADLQAVVSLHSNLLHVITRREGSKVDELKVGGKIVPFSGTTRVFQKMSDLKGVTVALVGSAQLLGQTLERQLGYGMNLVQADTDDEAVTLLKSNLVQAVFTTGGWPYPAVARHDAASGLMLAEYDLTPQPPFSLTKRNYPKLDAFNRNFLSSTNLLLTRPFKSNGERGKMVAALQKCILKNLDEFQEGPYQAAWKEVRSPMDTLGVTPIAPKDVETPSGMRARAAGKS